MAHPKKRIPIPRHKRPAKSLKKAGGSWGTLLRARLQLLQVAAGGSNIKFGARVRVDPRRVGQWLSGEVLPGAENLRAIALGMDVSLDWVFFGTDATGQATSDIQYRGQSRDMKTLEDDLAVAVWREIRATGLEIPDVSLAIYPPRLFEAAVEIVKRDVALWAKHVAEEEPLAEGITAIVQALHTTGGNTERKAEWKAARAALIQLLESRSVPSSVVTGSTLAFFRSEIDDDVGVFSGRISGGPIRNVHPDGSSLAQTRGP